MHAFSWKCSERTATTSIKRPNESCLPVRLFFCSFVSFSFDLVFSSAEAYTVSDIQRIKHTSTNSLQPFDKTISSCHAVRNTTTITTATKTTTTTRLKCLCPWQPSLVYSYTRVLCLISFSQVSYRRPSGLFPIRQDLSGTICLYVLTQADSGCPSKLNADSLLKQLIDSHTAVNLN